MINKMRGMCLDLLAFRNKYSKEKKGLEELLSAWLKITKGDDISLINWDIETTDSKVFIVVDFLELRGRGEDVEQRVDFAAVLLEDFFQVDWIKRLEKKQEADQKKAEEDKKKKEENQRADKLRHLHRTAEELGYVVLPTQEQGEEECKS